MMVTQLPTYQLDGWTGNSSDGYGVDWVITAEEGWSGPADARADIADRASQDGADDAPTYESARSITLTGTAIAQDWTAQNAAKDRLNAVAYTGRGLYPLVVAEHHATRLAYVRRTGGQKIADRAGYAFDFSISLVAPDPRKYDFAESALSAVLAGGVGAGGGRTYPRIYPLLYETAGITGSSSVVLARNIGNRETGAAITLTGGVNTPGIVNVETGQTIGFDLTLAPNDTLVVDLAARTAVLNGVASRRGALLTGSAWFTLPPGDTRLLMTGTPIATGTPSMTVRFRSAWK